MGCLSIYPSVFEMQFVGLHLSTLFRVIGKDPWPLLEIPIPPTQEKVDATGHLKMLVKVSGKFCFYQHLFAACLRENREILRQKCEGVQQRIHLKARIDC